MLRNQNLSKNMFLIFNFTKCVCYEIEWKTGITKSKVEIVEHHGIEIQNIIKTIVMTTDSYFCVN